jgi:hypothetical protein
MEVGSLRRRLPTRLCFSVTDSAQAEDPSRIPGSSEPAQIIPIPAKAYLSPPEERLRMTASSEKLAAFCRGGYSLNVCKNWPT